MYTLHGLTAALDELKSLGYSISRAQKIMHTVHHDGSWGAYVAGLPIRIDRRGRDYVFTY